MNSLDRLEANILSAMAGIMSEHPYVSYDNLEASQEDIFVGGYDAFRIVLQWIEQERDEQNGKK